MSDLGPLLERESHSVALGPDAFEGLLRRRERKQRNQRLAAAALATLIALGLGLAALREWRSAEEPHPASTGITAGTVANLETLWTGEVGGVVSPPAVGSGIVVAVNERGHLVAFEESCGFDRTSCEPSWTAEVGRMPTSGDRDFLVPSWLGRVGEPNGPDVWSGAVVEEGLVFVLAADGTLSVFPAACREDGGVCAPLWRAMIDEPVELPQLAGDVAIVPSGHGLWAYDVGCASDGAMCEPLWRSEGAWLRVQDGAVYATHYGEAIELDPLTGETIWIAGPGGRCAHTPEPVGQGCSNTPAPIRFGDTVYVNFGTELWALPTGCRGRCEPTWVGEITDAYSSGPVVVGGAAVLSVATTSNVGGVLAFPVDCTTDGQTCTEGHRTDVAYELTTFAPVVADGVVMPVSGRDSGVFAFDPGCLVARDGCEPLWTTFLSTPGQPVPSNDVVFLSDASIGTVQAVAARCPDAAPSEAEDALGSCEALWTSDYEPTGPVVVDGDQVFGTGTDGLLHAAGLGDGDLDTAPTRGRGQGWPILVVVLVAAGAVLLWRVRRGDRI